MPALSGRACSLICMLVLAAAAAERSWKEQCFRRGISPKLMYRHLRSSPLYVHPITKNAVSEVNWQICLRKTS